METLGNEIPQDPNVIDEILDEIEIEQRTGKKFRLGDKCEIYSHSECEWFLGQITNVSTDHIGEWLVVKYNENMAKEIQPLSDDIRVYNEKNNNNENKQKQDEKQIYDNDFDWDIILKELKLKNTNYIKNLITSKAIDINEQNPLDGRTLLIYSVIIGS
eukprot:251783_1